MELVSVNIIENRYMIEYGLLVNQEHSINMSKN
jgi:hypothetical protein